MICAVTALGELLIDFTQEKGKNGNVPSFTANPGGAPCNVLAMLAKLGRSTAFVGKVGQDTFGRFLKAAIEEAGIHSGGLRLDPDPAAHTTLAFVHNGADGEREFSFYRDPGADELLRAEELPGELLGNSRIFHFGSLSLTREPVRAATRAAVEQAKAGGALVSFDPNLRPSLWRDMKTAREEMLWGCSVCEILKVAREELVFLTGCEEEDKGTNWLRAQNPDLKLLLITDGSAGSRAVWNGLSVFCPAYRQVRAVDTTGAGDTFCGCCLHAVLEWGLEGLGEKRLREMLSFANAAAGLVTTRKGALGSMPAPEEIQRLMAEGPAGESGSEG